MIGIPPFPPIASENQFAAHAIHEGFDVLVKAAALLGDPVQDVDEHRAMFWIGILQAVQPAGNC